MLWINHLHLQASECKLKIDQKLRYRYNLINDMANLLEEKDKSKNAASVYKETKPKRKKSWLGRSIIGLVIVIILIGLAFGTKFVLSINSTNEISGRKISFFEQVKNIISKPEDKIKGEDADRINILLLGVGGAGHEGPYLTDTIIFASLKPSTGEVAMMSIPRDLLVNFPEYGWRKINNGLSFGNESNYPGGGEALMVKMVSEVTGLPIHYYARIDFEGFRKIINDLGGLDIYVDNSFSDYQYPDYNYGYQTITFKKGWQHMDGERALQFVRSRHGNNGEGSDFARSKRQQKVLLALKQKLLSFGTILNPNSIVKVLNDLGDHNRTNMQLWEMLRLASLGKDINQNQIITQVLDSGPNSPLYASTGTDGAYILQPKAGDFSEVQFISKNIFTTSYIARENASIEVRNGTSYSGLAKKIADELTALNFNVTQVSNAKDGNYEKTVIYDLTNGQKPYTLISLQNKLDANIAAGLPPFLTRSTMPINYDNLIPSVNSSDLSNSHVKAENVDLVIIVGKDKYQNKQAAK